MASGTNSVGSSTFSPAHLLALRNQSIDKAVATLITKFEERCRQEPERSSWTLYPDTALYNGMNSSFFQRFSELLASQGFSTKEDFYSDMRESTWTFTVTYKEEGQGPIWDILQPQRERNYQTLLNKVRSDIQKKISSSPTGSEWTISLDTYWHQTPTGNKVIDTIKKEWELQGLQIHETYKPTYWAHEPSSWTLQIKIPPQATAYRGADPSHFFTEAKSEEPIALSNYLETHLDVILSSPLLGLTSSIFLNNFAGLHGLPIANAIIEDAKRRVESFGYSLQEIYINDPLSGETWRLQISLPSREKPQAAAFPAAAVVTAPSPVKSSHLDRILARLGEFSSEPLFKLPSFKPLTEEEIETLRIHGYTVIEQPNIENEFSILLEKLDLNSTEHTPFSKAFAELVNRKVQEEPLALQWSVPIRSILDLSSDEELSASDKERQEAFGRLFPDYLLLELPSEQNAWSVTFMRKLEL